MRACGTRSAPSPAPIADGSSGAVACDHYHRYAEDVGLMRGLGIGGYRLSVAWPRVQPEGSGRRTARGWPSTTVSSTRCSRPAWRRWPRCSTGTCPQPLQDAGGWLNRDTVERFAEYATLALKLGDRVEHWATINEPNVVTMLGHALGVHAPGQTLMFDALPVAHHLLLAHARAVVSLRATGCAQRRDRQQPRADLARQRRPGRRGRRRLLRRHLEPASSPTRCCSAPTPTASPS